MLRLPIIQAPMAGGVVTPKMIAEVNKAGGLGSLPLGYLSIADAQKAIKQTQLVTSTPFAANIFISSKNNTYSATQLAQMLAHINDYRKKLDLPLKTDIEPLIEADADEMVDMAVAEGVSIISFTFGTLSHQKIVALKQKNVFVMGTATSVREGLQLEKLGCDAVIAQGYEAGGHRGGGFIEHQPGGLVGTMALVPQMVDALKIPVIAAGGMMNGKGVVAALALGAEAVQMGTGFLTCLESNASDLHKQAILAGEETSSVITPVFTGKDVRAMNNDFITDTEAKFTKEAILPYPLQHQLTKELRTKAVKSGAINYASFWSGQGNRLSRLLSVAEFMRQLEHEMAETLSLLAASNYVTPSRK